MVLLLPLIAACREDASVISGAMLDSSLSGQVWIDEEVDRFEIADGRFVVEGATGDTIDLQFRTSDGESGRMRLLGLPGGADLTLDGVWLEGGLAFATDAALGEGRVVEINGLRMGSLARLPGDAAIRGTVLAADRDRESLIIRPSDRNLPDLRIVVGEATQIQDADNLPSTLERLEFGDSLIVTGAVEGSYFLASLLTLPRSGTRTDVEEAPGPAAAPEERRNASREEDEAPAASQGNRRAPNAATGRGFRMGRRGQ